MNKNKLTTKNLIAIGIYNAVFFVLYAIVGFAMGLTPITYVFFYSLAGIVLGPVFMLMVTKSPKRGTILISSLVFGLIFLAIGGGHQLLILPVTGLIAEIITTKTEYKKEKALILAWVIFFTGFFLGTFVPIMFFEEWERAYAARSGIESGYIESIIGLVNGPLGFVVTVAHLVTAYLGGLFGAKLLNKHFLRAGIVQ
jgi:energy-coupling factor transport system substrate-specific component